MSALEQRISHTGPKKILACDGGGIRGLITVEILARVEELLRLQLGKGADFVLADYFDFVCGTSTGALVATCIAVGMPMSKIRDFYVASGKDMFEPASLLKRLQYKYDDEPLAKKLCAEFGADTTLGSPKLKSLLMMVMRNATTDSPWPVSNNPKAKFNDLGLDDCNLKIPLWQLVRASTAAPTYFPPEVVNVGKQTFVFVDGGITSYNNPAFLAFLMATAASYQVNWEAGEDKLLVVSVGTGGFDEVKDKLKASDMNLLYSATSVPNALMNASSAGNDMACRVLGKCLAGDAIDSEVGDLRADQGAATSSFPKLFTYLRYNPTLTRAGLDALGLKTIKPANIQQMDSVKHIKDIQRVGDVYANLEVRPGHFAKFN